MTKSRPGLRLQILFALASVMLVAFVPLFFAVAQMARATALAYREDGARVLGKSVASSVRDIVSHDAHASRSLDAIRSPAEGELGVLAVVVFAPDGEHVAESGDPSEIARISAPPSPYVETTSRARSVSGGRALDVVVPEPFGATVVRVRTDEDPARTAGILRGIALYMFVFALALLVFAYMMLTRAIVKPIERLARAADRVATGARSFERPVAAPREISELGESVFAMTTKLRAEENALRAKIDELTATTTRLTHAREALSDTRERLADSEHMASIGKLAAGVAHEIGNPIAAIMGLHDLLQDGELDASDREDFLRRMRKETERIHGVVRDLLDYARPDSSQGSSPLPFANVHDVLDDVLALMKPQKEWRNVDAALDVPANLVVAIAPQRLTQVFLNLLLNAGAAMAGRENARVRIDAKIAEREGRSTARIVVEDDGPGVPEDLRDRIFDPFVTTKDVGAGTGLGLSVCKGIVEAASGTIRLDSGADRGARFVIELPIANAG